MQVRSRTGNLNKAIRCRGNIELRFAVVLSIIFLNDASCF